MSRWMTCFLMRVLHCLKDRRNTQASQDPEATRITPFGQRAAFNVLIDKIRQSRWDRLLHRTNARCADARGSRGCRFLRANRCSRSVRQRPTSGSFSATSRLNAPSARRASHTSPYHRRQEAESACTVRTRTDLQADCGTRSRFGRGARAPAARQASICASASPAMRLAKPGQGPGAPSATFESLLPAASSCSASSSRRLIRIIWGIERPTRPLS